MYLKEGEVALPRESSLLGFEECGVLVIRGRSPDTSGLARMSYGSMECLSISGDWEQERTKRVESVWEPLNVRLQEQMKAVV